MEGLEKNLKFFFKAFKTLEEIIDEDFSVIVRDAFYTKI